MVRIVACGLNRSGDQVRFTVHLVPKASMVDWLHWQQLAHISLPNHAHRVERPPDPNFFQFTLTLCRDVLGIHLLHAILKYLIQAR